MLMWFKGRKSFAYANEEIIKKPGIKQKGDEKWQVQSGFAYL